MNGGVNDFVNDISRAVTFEALQWRALDQSTVAGTSIRGDAPRSLSHSTTEIHTAQQLDPTRVSVTLTLVLWLCSVPKPDPGVWSSLETTHRNSAWSSVP